MRFFHHALVIISTGARWAMNTSITWTNNAEAAGSGKLFKQLHQMRQGITWEGRSCTGMAEGTFFAGQQNSITKAPRSFDQQSMADAKGPAVTYQ